MFLGVICLAISTLFSFKDVRSGGSNDFEEGDTYGPIGGYSEGAAESGGASYQTDDAVPPANSHDL